MQDTNAVVIAVLVATNLMSASWGVGNKISERSKETEYMQYRSQYQNGCRKQIEQAVAEVGDKMMDICDEKLTQLEAKISDLTTPSKKGGKK